MLRSNSQNMTPRAKKFFVRSTCFAVMSRPARAPALRVEIGITKTPNPESEPSVEGACGVAGLRQVGRRERVAVDDDRAARDDVPGVGREGGRVHRNEDVGCVARRVDVARAEADLEPRDAAQRSGRGPDLGGIVRQRADVVAEDGSGPGELGARQLHAVAGVAGEADRDAVQLADRDIMALRARHGTSWLLLGLEAGAPAGTVQALAGANSVPQRGEAVRVGYGRVDRAWAVRRRAPRAWRLGGPRLGEPQRALPLC